MLTFVSHPNVLVFRGNGSTSAPLSCAFARRHWLSFPHSNGRAATNELKSTSEAEGKVSQWNRANSVMQSELVTESGNEDDDDEVFGSEPVYGMRMPSLSEEDQEYVDSAPTNEEFMKRMAAVARRIDQQRLIDNSRNGKQTAETYIESLNKVQMHQTKASPKSEPASKSSPPPSKSTVISADNENPSTAVGKSFSDGAKVEESVEEIEARIARINQDLVKAMTDQDLGSNSESVEDDNDYTPEKLAQDAATLERVQREIREQLTGKEPDFETLQTKSEAVADLNKINAKPANSPEMVERQIAYLEKHLEKLKRDSEADEDEKKLAEESGSSATPAAAEEESLEKLRSEGISMMDKLEQHLRNPDSTGRSPPASSSTSKTTSPETPSAGPRFDGLEDAPGELSAEEKRAAFEALRKQAMQRQGGNEFADPYNVTLPSKRDSTQPTNEELQFDSDVGSSRELVGADDDDGDMPTGDEAEYDAMGEVTSLDSRLLIEEIEVEMKSYTEEARRLLRNHESRMSVLLTRLTAQSTD